MILTFQKGHEFAVCDYLCKFEVRKGNTVQVTLVSDIKYIYSYFFHLTFDMYNYVKTYIICKIYKGQRKVLHTIKIGTCGGWFVNITYSSRTSKKCLSPCT